MSSDRHPTSSKLDSTPSDNPSSPGQRSPTLRRRRRFGSIRKRGKHKYQASYFGPDGKRHSAGIFRSEADASRMLDQISGPSTEYLEEP